MDQTILPAAAAWKAGLLDLQRTWIPGTSVPGFLILPSTSVIRGCSGSLAVVIGF